MITPSPSPSAAPLVHPIWESFVGVIAALDPSAVIAAVSAVAAIAAVFVQYLLLPKPFFRIENVYVDAETNLSHFSLVNRGNALAYDVQMSTMKHVSGRLWSRFPTMAVAETKSMSEPREQLKLVTVRWRQPPFMFRLKKKTFRPVPVEWQLSTPHFNHDGTIGKGTLWMPINDERPTLASVMGGDQYERWLEHQHKLAIQNDAQNERIAASRVAFERETEALRTARLAREATSSVAAEAEESSTDGAALTQG